MSAMSGEFGEVENDTEDCMTFLLYTIHTPDIAYTSQSSKSNYVKCFRTCSQSVHDRHSEKPRTI